MESATDPVIEASTTTADPAESTPQPADPNEISGSWETVRATFRDRFPDLKEGILFCIWKLEQDPRLTLKDFREEARVRGIPLGGRSLHSARLALGIETPAPRRPKPRATGRTGAAAPMRQTPSPGSLEAQLLAGVQQMQQAAGMEASRLREAIRDAIATLQNALDD